VPLSRLRCAGRKPTALETPANLKKLDRLWQERNQQLDEILGGTSSKPARSRRAVTFGKTSSRATGAAAGDEESDEEEDGAGSGADDDEDEEEEEEDDNGAGSSGDAPAADSGLAPVSAKAARAAAAGAGGHAGEAEFDDVEADSGASRLGAWNIMMYWRYLTISHALCLQ